MAQTPKIVTERALAGKLRGLSRPDIKAFADAINRLGGGGFKPDDVFPVGIVVNSPDGAEVRGHVSNAQIGEIVKLIPEINPRSVTIFPRGIVVQDSFRVHVKLNGG